MARIPRIPRTINEFHNYLTNTAAYMQQSTPPNATRLGLSDAEIARWEAYRQEWTPLYWLYADKKNSRTTAVRDQLVALIGSVVAYDRTNHIVDRIASSPAAVVTDYEIFRIKAGILKKSSRTVPSSPITEQVSVSLHPLGGGQIKIKCYALGGHRAAILEGANGVQYRYCIGAQPPASAEADGLKTEISTRAIFSLDPGAAASEKRLYIYLRWYNTHYPQLAGPWCSLQSTLIL